MNRKTSRVVHFALLAILLVLLGAVIMPAIRHGHVCGPRDVIHTKMDLSAISTALSLYVREKPGFPELTATNISGNAQLFATLLAADLVSKEQGKDGEFADDWGRPFHVITRHRTVDAKGIITCDRSSILIWSDGRNGRNEDGEGDDLSAECFLGVRTVFCQGGKVVGVGEHYLPAHLKSKYGE